MTGNKELYIRLLNTKKKSGCNVSSKENISFPNKLPNDFFFFRIRWINIFTFHRTVNIFFFFTLSYLEVEEDIQGHDKGEVEEGENVPVDVEDGGVVLLEDQCNGITCQKGNEKE